MASLANIRVKANAHYICQECGATEFIQAHHKIRGDDNSLIALCADCHSRKHPNVPRALFFTKQHQPYWHNKSASSLAKTYGVCSRTIIRTAKKLRIQPGELKPCDEELIRTNITVLPSPAEETTLVNSVKIKRDGFRCQKCGHEWVPKNADNLPRVCPKCKSAWWDQPKRSRMDWGPLVAFAKEIDF